MRAAVSGLVRAMLSFDGLRRVKVERCGKDVKKDAESSEKVLSCMGGWDLHSCYNTPFMESIRPRMIIKGWESAFGIGLASLPHVWRGNCDSRQRGDH